MVSKQDASNRRFEMKDLKPEPESPFLDEAAYDLPIREEAWDFYEAEPEPQLETPFASALAEDGQLASTREEEFLSLPDTEEKESLITQHEQASPEELPFLDRELESLHDANEEEEASFLEGKVEEEAEESDEQAAVSNSYFRIANDITSAFEGGKPDTLNLRDNGIISYGKHQATLSAGTLFFILKRYSELSQTDASRRVTSYLDRVRRKDEGLRSDKTFLQLLKDSAREPEMSRAQDEVFATRYWNPAKTAAAQMGVQSALGHVLFYNTRVQGGLGSVLRRTTKQLGGKVGDVVAGRRVTEHDFLTAFVGQFISHRLANSARNAARARQLEEEALAFERQAAAAEPGVAKKLLREAHGKRRKAASNAVNAKALKRSATKTRGPSFKVLVASGDLELRGGADGFVRLAGKPGVRIQGLRPAATIDEIPSQLMEERSNHQLEADLAPAFSAPQSSRSSEELEQYEDEEGSFLEGMAQGLAEERPEEETEDEDDIETEENIQEDTGDEFRQDSEESPEEKSSAETFKDYYPSYERQLPSSRTWPQWQTVDEGGGVIFEMSALSTPFQDEEDPITVTAHRFKGRMTAVALVLAGVHGDEHRGVTVVEEVIKALKAGLKDPKRKRPFFTTIVIQKLFDRSFKAQDRYVNDPVSRRKEIEPNRNFPRPGESYAHVQERAKSRTDRAELVDWYDQPLADKHSQLTNRMLAENRILVQLIERVKPARAASIHDHRIPGKRGDGPGIFVDPRGGFHGRTDQPFTDEGKSDDSLATDMREEARSKIKTLKSFRRAFNGNLADDPKKKGVSPPTVHYTSTEHPPGTSFGMWAPVAECSGSIRKGMTTITVEVPRWGDGSELKDVILAHADALLNNFLLVK